MTRQTAITLSFLIVLLVIAGMTIKHQLQNVPIPIADSLAKHPEQVMAVERGLEIQKAKDIKFGNAWNVDTAWSYTDDLDSAQSAQANIYHWIDTIPNDFPEHSKIPTR